MVHIKSTRNVRASEAAFANKIGEKKYTEALILKLSAQNNY
jgi:hypothetical protein